MSNESAGAYNPGWSQQEFDHSCLLLFLPKQVSEPQSISTCSRNNELSTPRCPLINPELPICKDMPVYTQ
jgi:hypothetical protein